jgi:hypothetical protein
MRTEVKVRFYRAYTYRVWTVSPMSNSAIGRRPSEVGSVRDCL